jgi:hypothetical protein
MFHNNSSMHNTFKIILGCFLILVTCTSVRESIAMEIYFGDSGPPKSDEVHIGSAYIMIPPEKILIVRKEGHYCAIKFTKLWTGKNKDDSFASYESYCQMNNTSGFSMGNIQTFKGKLSYYAPRGIGRLSFSFGNAEIKCGSIKLISFGQGEVLFDPTGQNSYDHGIELAPTNWDNISDVDISDSRLRWYKFDSRRKHVNIKINEFSYP